VESKETKGGALSEGALRPGSGPPSHGLSESVGAVFARIESMEPASPRQPKSMSLKEQVRLRKLLDKYGEDFEVTWGGGMALRIKRSFRSRRWPARRWPATQR
jgi:hypothetical protein